MRLLSVLMSLVISLKVGWAADVLSLSPSLASGAVALDAPLWFAAEDAPVVGLVANCFAGDIALVMAHRPAVTAAQGNERPAAGEVVVVGTVGRSHLIDDLVQRRLLDARAIAGAWESTLIQVVEAPWPGVPRALVVAGSDRRGTAYGLFELSRRLGISPWTWWADVPPTGTGRRWAAGREVLATPAVRWRGIFINDEDWGIQPWAAAREPEVGSLGPKTYARVAELLLRLKANLLWPAMHDCTKAFNSVPGNAATAEAWAIVMGSSHCEPMLRNNVGEWSGDKKAWNWVTNREAMTAYWRERVQANAADESFWTLGLRGIHDGAAAGGGTTEQQARRMEEVLAVQRRLLRDGLGRDLATVPQMFVPYKEVLDLYDAGLHVPDDVTLVWPDDNHGYLRRLPSAAERRRSGGHGIYYHLSYWGAPISYLWLDSTPPARIACELDKARAFGAERLWMINVGDIACMERGMTFALDMAWHPDAAVFHDQRAWLETFASEQFGATIGPRIGGVLNDYYHLVAECRPEHVLRQVADDPLRDPAIAARYVARWERTVAELKAIPVPAGREDAFFRLVAFPVEGAAAMAAKWLSPDAAAKAHDRIGELTRRYNAAAGGAWAKMMSASPSPGMDGKANAFVAPRSAVPSSTVPTYPGPHPEVTLSDLSTVALLPGRDGRRRWQRRDGLVDGAALLQPDVAADPVADPAQAGDAPAMVLTIAGRNDGKTSLHLHALPTQPPYRDRPLRVAVAVDDGQPAWVEFPEHKEHSPAWKTMVLTQRMTATVTLDLAAGTHRVLVYGTEPTVVLTGVDVGK